MLFAVVLFALNYYVPKIFKSIGQWYITDANWIIAVGINSGLLAFSLTQAKEILFPTNNTLGLLKKWPDYVLLKDTTLVGIIYCGLCAICSFFVFIFKKELSEYLGLLFLINLAISITASASLVLAHWNVKIIVGQSEES